MEILQARETHIDAQTKQSNLTPSIFWGKDSSPLCGRNEIQSSPSYKQSLGSAWYQPIEVTALLINDCKAPIFLLRKVKWVIVLEEKYSATKLW